MSQERFSITCWSFTTATPNWQMFWLLMSAYSTSMATKLLDADPSVSADEIRAFGTGSLRKAVFDGDLSGGSFLAGEVAGLIRKREPAAAIVNDIMDGAEKVLAQANNLIYGS